MLLFIGQKESPSTYPPPRNDTLCADTYQDILFAGCEVTRSPSDGIGFVHDSHTLVGRSGMVNRVSTVYLKIRDRIFDLRRVGCSTSKEGVQGCLRSCASMIERGSDMSCSEKKWLPKMAFFSPERIPSYMILFRDDQ